MKIGRLLLCLLVFALTLWGSQASANPAPFCETSCYQAPCTMSCSIWDDNGHYTNITCYDYRPFSCLR